MRKLTVMILAATALSGCATSPGFVSREWASNMRELGVNPLFPPRADLRVGDVFIVEGNASEDSNQPDVSSLGVLFDNLKVNDELNDFYRTRPGFTASTLAEPSVLNLAPLKEAEPIKLRSVAFPGFVKATASGADVAGLVSAQGVPVGFASGLRAANSAVLTVSATESYSLPLNAILIKVGGETEWLKKIQASLQPSSLRAPRYVDVVLVNEVYFARSFNVTLHEEDSASLSANATIPSTAAPAANAASVVPSATGVATSAATATGAAASAATPTGTATTSTAATGTAAPSTAGTTTPATAVAGTGASPVAPKTAAELAVDANKHLNDSLANSTKAIPTTAGGTFSAGHTATGNVTLTQDYKEPIAIGYRGIRRRLQLSQVDGKETFTVAPSTTLTPLAGKLPVK